MNLVVVKAKCRFCQRPIEMEVDERGWLNPAINAAGWLRCVSCLRCADFYVTRQKLAAEIVSACNLLRASPTKQKDTKFLEIIRFKLTLMTQKYARHLCDHHYVELVWDEEFVNLLLAKPASAFQILRTYEFNLKKLRSQPEPEPLQPVAETPP